MKAFIISQKAVYGGPGVYGLKCKIQYILIPEANNLAVTVNGDNVSVQDNFNATGCKRVKKINVPALFVGQAHEFMRIQARLKDFCGQCLKPPELC